MSKRLARNVMVGDYLAEGSAVVDVHRQEGMVFLRCEDRDGTWRINFRADELVELSNR